MNLFRRLITIIAPEGEREYTRETIKKKIKVCHEAQERLECSDQLCNWEKIN